MIVAGGDGIARSTQSRRSEESNGIEDEDDLLDSTGYYDVSRYKDLYEEQSASVKDRHGNEHVTDSVLIDTGSKNSFITRKRAEEMELEVRPLLRKLESVDGRNFDAVAYVNSTIRLPDIEVGEIEIRTLICPLLSEKIPLLIGRRAITKHKLVAKILENKMGWKELPSSAESSSAEETVLVAAPISRRSKCELTKA